MAQGNSSNICNKLLPDTYTDSHTTTTTTTTTTTNRHFVSSKLDHNLVTYKSQQFYTHTYIHKHTLYVYVLKVNCFNFEKISMNYLTLFWTISHFYRSKHVDIQQNVYCLLFYVDGLWFIKINYSQWVYIAVSSSARAPGRLRVFTVLRYLQHFSC